MGDESYKNQRLHCISNASHINNLVEKKTKQYLQYVAWQHLYSVPLGSCFCLSVHVFKATRETLL